MVGILGRLPHERADTACVEVVIYSVVIIVVVLCIYPGVFAAVSIVVTLRGGGPTRRALCTQVNFIKYTVTITV